MFLKAISENGNVIVTKVDFEGLCEGEVLHPIDFLHDVYNAYLLTPIYTYTNNEAEFEVIKQWLGNLYV